MKVDESKSRFDQDIVNSYLKKTWNNVTMPMAGWLELNIKGKPSKVKLEQRFAAQNGANLHL